MKQRLYIGVTWFAGFIFLLSSLMPGFSEQMSKMPSLIHHYKHHVEEHDEQISFIHFLAMHYGENASHRNDEDHSDLPLFQFAAHNYVAMELASFPVPVHASSSLLVQHYTSYSCTYSFKSARSIFQPPRA